MAFVEHGAVLVGERRGPIWLLRRRRLVRGEPHQVETDWRWALAREERSGDVAGFFHTHPPGAGPRPSRRDVRTMQVWCGAFGKPLLCVIACEGRALATRFSADDDPGAPVGLAELFPRGALVVVEGGAP